MEFDHLIMNPGALHDPSENRKKKNYNYKMVHIFQLLFHFIFCPDLDYTHNGVHVFLCLFFFLNTHKYYVSAGDPKCFY